MNENNRLIVLLSLLLCALLLGGCAKKAQPVVIELEENPSTGFTWNYTTDVEGVLNEVGSEFTQPKDSLPGAGGVHVFTFAPAADGTVTLTFLYGQTWEGGMKGDTRIYTYTVQKGVASLVSEDVIPAPETMEQLLRVDAARTEADGIKLDVVYLNSETAYDDVDGESIPYDNVTEVDGLVHTLTLSQDAYIAFSEDMGPNTTDITAAEFPDRFAAANSGSGIYYTAMIAGDIVTSLVFYYTE